MLAILVFAATLASAAPDAPKPAPAAEGKPHKPGEVCTTKKVGRLFGHDVIRTKCVDAKPAADPAPAAAAPSTPG